MRRGSDRDTAWTLSQFAADLSFEDIPAAVIDTARLFIADYCGAVSAGMMINRQFNQAVLDAVQGMFPPLDAVQEGRTAHRQKDGERAWGSASVFGLKQKLPAEMAAFMNGIYAHGADMDDGNRKSMGHIGAHVISAVFALAQELGNVRWQDVVTAVITGYEVFNRLGAMAQPGLVRRGFHSTGTAGAPACAAACGKLMGLETEKIYSAISIAAVQSSGLMLIAESGQSCKPLNPANAARTGIFSAKLAARGVRGPVNPMESGKGWFHAMTDEIHDEMLEGLGENFTICESYLKPYPSCRHTHCGIEAAARISGRLRAAGKNAGDIRKASLFIYPNAIEIAGQIRVPATPEEAKFSIHYSLAAALYTGRYSLKDLEREPSAQIRALTEKITLIPDPSMEKTTAGIRGARLSVELTDGGTEEETVLLPKGDSANPMTWDDMEEKLRACMEEMPWKAEDVIRNIRALDMERPFEGIEELLADKGGDGG